MNKRKKMLIVTGTCLCVFVCLLYPPPKNVNILVPKTSYFKYTFLISMRFVVNFPAYLSSVAVTPPIMRIGIEG